MAICHHKRLSLIVIGLSVFLLLVLPVISGDRRQKQYPEKVAQYPDIPINDGNSEGHPLSIQSASVKEITRAEYQQLTRGTANADVYTTFPQVTVINNTNRSVTGFGLLLDNKHTGITLFLLLQRLSIEPNKSYSVPTTAWIMPDQHFHAMSNGDVLKNKIGQPTQVLDAQKMWLIGSAAELLVRVGVVIYEDGSQWKPDRINNQSQVRSNSQAMSYNVVARASMKTNKTMFECNCSCGATCPYACGGGCFFCVTGGVR